MRTDLRRVATLLLVLAATALSTVADANHAWGTFHWGTTALPFTLKAGDNVSATWDAYLDEAISDWSQSSVLGLTKVAGSTRPKICRPTSGRLEVCNAAYGGTGWLGVAQIWANGSHITQATAKMNDTYFNTATYNTPEWRRMVMCQEVAHDFGLGHQDEVFNNPNLGSCMDYTSNPDGPPSNQHPNIHDFEQIFLIYNHLDATSTMSGSSPNGSPAIGEIDLDSPGQWGRLVRSNQTGRVQVYERDFGRGHKVITHVFWADPVADARQ